MYTHNNNENSLLKIIQSQRLMKQIRSGAMIVPLFHAFHGTLTQTDEKKTLMRGLNAIHF